MGVRIVLCMGAGHVKERLLELHTDHETDEGTVVREMALCHECTLMEMLDKKKSIKEPEA